MWFVCCWPSVLTTLIVSDIRYFISYLKKPDNNERWHEGKIEQGNDEDWVGENRDGAADWI